MTESSAQLINFLTSQQIPYVSGALLRDYTTFRLGGPCPLLVDCKTAAQVQAVVRKLLARHEDFLLIGGGSNLVVSDDGLDRIVVRYAAETPQVSHTGDVIEVSGGTSLDDLAAYSVAEGLAGLVKTSGIPGTVGGAIAGNAGAFGWQMGDGLISVTLMDRAGTIRRVTPADIGFSYRDSGIKHTGDIVLSAELQLAHGDRDALHEEREEIMALRRQKHPNLDHDCCAGSFFRNIEPTSKAARRQAAGYFLEQAGAKEMRVGGAGVFPKHANIIVKADASCTAQDVCDLQARMAAAVKAMFDLDLTREVRLLGRFESSGKGPDGER